MNYKSVGIRIIPNSLSTKFELKSFFKGIAKCISAIPLESPNLFINGIFELVDVVTIKKDIHAQAYCLTVNSLIYSIVSLIVEELNLDLINEDINTDEIDKKIESHVFENEYYVSNEIFKYPEKLLLLNDLTPFLNEFLENFLFSCEQKDIILLKFKGRFGIALHREWLINSDNYALLISHLESPFQQTNDLQQEWIHYFESLSNKVLENNLIGGLTLSDIYINLRAFYEYLDDKKGKKRQAVYIEKYLLNWITEIDNSKIKIISGGPGSGKSSVMKMLSSKLAKNNYPILYIPLDAIQYTNNLEDSLDRYFRNKNIFEKVPLTKTDKIVLIFDGLDELPLIGENITEITQSFLSQVKLLIKQLNTKSKNVKAIISGRDMIIQELSTNFEISDTLYLLPYYINDEQKKKFEYSNKRILDDDQRKTWWDQYRLLAKEKFIAYKKINFQDKYFQDFSSQPLLNYLYALTVQEEKPIPNKNVLYKMFIDEVFHRKYADTELESLKKINGADFDLLLQNIAVLMWKDKGRSITVEHILNNINSNVLRKHFDFFKTKGGITSLLGAFYFSKDGQMFEFTHKSFQEYLVAVFLVNESLLQINSNSTLKLDNWVNIYSDIVIDDSLISFIHDELILQELPILQNLHTCLQDSTNEYISEYLKTFPLPIILYSYKNINSYLFNITTSLFLLLGLISELLDSISNIEWENQKGFSLFYRQIRMQTNNHYNKDLST